MFSDGCNRRWNSELIFVAHFPPAGLDSKHLSLTDRHMNTLAVTFWFVCLFFSPPTCRLITSCSFWAQFVSCLTLSFDSFTLLCKKETILYYIIFCLILFISYRPTSFSIFVHSFDPDPSSVSHYYCGEGWKSFNTQINACCIDTWVRLLLTPYIFMGVTYFTLRFIAFLPRAYMTISQKTDKKALEWYSNPLWRAGLK